MENLIRLNETQKEQFKNFIKNNRKKIIPKPIDILKKVLSKYDTNNINLTSISQTIINLRELSYNEFLIYENEFNAALFLTSQTNEVRLCDQSLALWKRTKAPLRGVPHKNGRPSLEELKELFWAEELRNPPRQRRKQ